MFLYKTIHGFREGVKKHLYFQGIFNFPALKVSPSLIKHTMKWGPGL